MKTDALNSLSPDELYAIPFHPKRTLKCRFKSFFHGAWYFSVAMVFLLGLPFLSVWVLDVIPRLLGR